MKKLLAILLLLPVLAMAWEPVKPVTIIIGNAPGAGNEIAARKLSEIVQKTNPGYIYVVQNMPGADSVISMNHFLTVAPDGYTVAIPSHMSTYVTNDIWEKSVKKFEFNSFTDVLTIGKSPLCLIVSARSKTTTPQEFVKLIQSTSRPISVAVGGGAHRTAFEYLMLKGKGNKELVRTIKFNGPAQALQSVAQFDGTLGTEFGIMPIAIAKPLADSGRVRVIGLTGQRRMPQVPDVPLLRDVAPGINVFAAWTLALPPNTPPDIVEWFQKAYSTAARSAEYREWMDSQVIFIEEKELTPAGIRKQAEELRAVFLPVLQSIDVTRD
jgi:tripartite-type tricarboxylate transporter receptor subunit TctC